MQANEILSALEEDIVFGMLSPKSRLVEERLAERFDTKRHVIREVFSALEKLGLVERVPNKGAILTEFAPTEVLHIYEVRQMLEQHACSTTPLPFPSELLIQMEGIQCRNEAAVFDGRYHEIFRLCANFHRLQYSVCPNKHLVQTINDYARKAHMITAADFDGHHYMTRMVAQNRKFIEAMIGQDNQKLVELIKSHFSSLSSEYFRSYNIRYGLGRPKM